jgi:hypothetical protein
MLRVHAIVFFLSLTSTATSPMLGPVTPAPVQESHARARLCQTADAGCMAVHRPAQRPKPALRRSGHCARSIGSTVRRPSRNRPSSTMVRRWGLSNRHRRQGHFCPRIRIRPRLVAIRTHDRPKCFSESCVDAPVGARDHLNGSGDDRVQSCVRPRVRPSTRRGPVWRYADQVQFRFASAKLVDSHCFSWPRPVRSVCPYRFLDLPHRRRINADAVRLAPALILDTPGPC